MKGMRRHCSFAVFYCFLFLNFGIICGNQLYAQNPEMGMGFFAPNFTEGESLYFYDNPGNFKNSINLRASDSITFKKVGYNTVIDYAPPWFKVIHQKLDYGIFLLRVKRLGRDYHELVVNETTGRTAFVTTYSGSYSSWPEFLISVFTIEFISEDQKIYDNPLIKSAGRVYDQSQFRAVFIDGDWMQIEILDTDFKAVDNGWIRWRKDGKLRIRYNLFS